MAYKTQPFSILYHSTDLYHAKLVVAEHILLTD
jgi:hypothetical protein